MLKIDTGELVIISDLASPNPRTERRESGKDAGLYFLWQGGGRKAADKQLCEKAGVTVGDNPILHFYPPETEQALLRLEKGYARRDFADIRRTNFNVEADGRGFKFVVTRQMYR